MMDTTKLFLRKVEIQDSPELERIIKTVMPQFGACGAGFSINDPEVTDIYSAYQAPQHSYFVVTDGNKVYGGAGIAPLAGEKARVCELRKMYFLPEIRGLGLGKKLLELCLEEAQLLGFEYCYLETLTRMRAAQELYILKGFDKIDGPLGNTGHFGCDSYFLKKLDSTN